VETVLNSPFVIFTLSFLLMWLSVEFGGLIRRWHPAQEGEREHLAVLTNATLTLLALVIAFSFSMAVNRYDQRKNYEEEEANAIGTEYARAGLLPDAEATQVRQLLTRYLDQRLLFYTTRDANRLQQLDSETARLQAQMWSIVRVAATDHPTPPVALAVSGMNDVLNRQGYTQAAWWNRIPLGAWSLMAALAVCCSLLVGYGASRYGHVRLTVLPLIISLAFFLISDIDSPRRGVIRVLPQNLISLSQSLGK
jgi:hypothetical protein